MKGDERFRVNPLVSTIAALVQQCDPDRAIAFIADEDDD
jgi:hypothetical protein